MADSSPLATREMPPLLMRAEVRPGSVDLAARTVKVDWSTGARVLRGGLWSDPYYEELSLDPSHVRLGRLNNGAPFLDAHDGYATQSVLGVVENGSATVNGKRGTAVVRFAKAEDDPEADKVFRKVADGILQNVSVGYRVHKLEKIEGGEGKVPVMRATDWEPFEISVVPMGADDGAGFRGAEKQVLNPCVFVTHEEKRATMADPTSTTAPVAPVTPAAPAVIAADGARAIEQSVAQAEQRRIREMREQQEMAERAASAAQERERHRIADIQQIVRRHNLGGDLEQTLIRSGAPIEAVNAAVLSQLADRDQENPTNSHLRFEAGDDKRDKFIRGACAAIYQRAGTAPAIEAAKKIGRLSDQFRAVDTDPGEYRGMRISDLARAALELRGVNTRSLHGEALIKRALSYRDAGMNTTSDFAIILETAVNKTFLGQYALTPVTWPMWCGRKSVQDFRTSTFYRPGTFGRLDAVSESGEVAHKHIPDGEKRTLTPATKGNIIGLTRRAMVNDDLGAFRDLATQLGLAAALTVEADAFALITANSGLGANYDSNPLFHSSRSNIGPTGAMSVATLDGARAAMAKQKDPSSNQFLALRPSCWLGPVELGGQAKVFNASSADPTDNKNSGVANRVKGLFDDARIIDSPYLSAVSATRHYLLADPGLYPVFAVGFIDGQEAPVVTSEQSFEFDGMQIKIVMDYGTAVLDYRGAITCAGA